MNTGGGEDEASNSIGGDKSFKSAQEGSECSSRPAGGQVISAELLHEMQMHALLEFVWGLQWTNTKKTERAERVSEAYAANIHSRRCDAARDRKSALNDKASVAWRESSKFWPLDVEKWLNIAPERPSGLHSPGNPLTSFDGLQWLGSEDIDSLATLMVGDLLRSAHRSHLFERMCRVVYTAAKGLDKHLATGRLKESLSVEMPELIDSLSSACISYCILAIECAEYFGEDLSQLSPAEIVENLRNLLDSPAGLHMLPQFVVGLSGGDLTSHLVDLWSSLYKDLDPLCISNLQTKTVNSLIILAGIPEMRVLLVKSTMWLPPSTRVYPLISNTMLGRLIGRVSMVDFIQTPKSFVTEKMKTYMHPQGISPNLTPYLSMIEVAQENHIKSCVQFLKLFLKHGLDVRQSVLDWFSRVIEMNIEQTKLYNRASQPAIVRMTPAALDWMFFTNNTIPYSVSFNICWVLMLLCVPISIEKIKDVDALFGEYCRASCEKGGVLAESWLTETRMKSDEHLDSMEKSSQSLPPKFITQIFWLTLKAQKMLFFQCVNDALQRQIQLVQIVTNSSEAPNDPSMKERLCSEVILWQSILRLEEFVTPYLHFVDLLNAFISRAIFLSVSIKKDQGVHPNPICQGLGLPAQLKWPEKEEDVSREFQSMPVEYISDTYEAFSKYISITMTPTFMRPSTMSIENAFSVTNCELFSIVLFTILGGSDHLITAPAMRLDIGGRCIASLGTCKTLRNRVCTNEAASQLLAPSICLGFVHAQKLSYYSRIDMRLILTRELERLLPDQSFRDSMDCLAKLNQADFERFLLFLSSNISYVLEEALTYLTEIKSRESRPSTINSQNPPPEIHAPTNNSAAGGPDDEEAFTREAERVAQEVEGTRNVEEMNFEQLTSQCQNFMAAGSASLKAFSELDSRCFKFIRNNKILIDPTVSCLDSCLASLVGPKCMALKVTNFSKYNFNPRELLADLVKIYVKFIGEDSSAPVLKAIRDDQRFYSKKLFDKAVRIVKREGLTSDQTTRQFEELVEQLNAGDEENDWLDELIMSGEVPDEFIDPLMSDVMRDPVMLPTSNVVVERSVIERHLLSDQFDPFNRKPLDRSMLIAQDDLRSRIEEFLNEAKQKRLH